MRKLYQQFKTLIRQGRLAGLDDSKHTQTAQVELFDGEIVNQVERVQNYGFTSNPSAGGVYVMNIGGKSNQPVIIVVNDDAARVKLENGNDVAVYHAEGHKILLTQSGEIRAECTRLIVDAAESVEVNTADAIVNADAVMIDAPDTYMTGSLTVDGAVSFGGGGKITGDLDVSGDVKSKGVSLPHHKHTDSIGGKTSESDK